MLDGFETSIANSSLASGACMIRCIFGIASRPIPFRKGFLKYIPSVLLLFLCRSRFLVRIQPNRSLTIHEQQRTVMQWYSGSKNDVQKVEWQNGWASCRFRDFGAFRLVTG